MTVDNAEHSAFPHLLAPLDRGRLQLKNRVVFPSHQTLFSEGGVIGDRMHDYYLERAKGGVAAVIIEGAAVHVTTVKFPEYLIAYDPRIIPSLDRVADSLHTHGCKAFFQLAHSGSRMSTFDSRREVWGPSTQRAAISPEIPHEMTASDIGELLDGYRLAVTNAVSSRVDGIEIHAAHEYLLSEFLSPFHNHRTDHYGGSLENRARLLLEVVELARATAGERDDFVIGVRLNGSDLTSDGLDIDDAVRVAQMIEATGAVDFLNVSAGTSRDNHLIVPSMEWPQGIYVKYASAIRAAVDLPVIAVGRIKRPEHADQIIADGHADVLAEARALIADPFWVAKAGAIDGDDGGGRGTVGARGASRIRPCIACNQGCFGNLYGNHPITCTVNPAVGLEATLGAGTEPSHPARHVLVVGGGPAGLEAAIAAAELGHRVTLCEATDRLGGQIVAAASIPTRSELSEIVDFQIRELGRLGVDVRLDIRIDDALIETYAPDELVVATGSQPPSELSAVLATDGSLPLWSPIALMTAADDALPAGTIVIVDGVGHFPAYAPAERLVDAGRSVTVLGAALAPAGNMDHSTMVSTLRRLATKGVRIVTMTAVTGVATGEVQTRDVLSGQTGTITADAVVVATGNVADDHLARSQARSGRPVHLVGDALAPRTMLHAIREGRLAARQIGAVGPLGAATPVAITPVKLR